MRRRQIGRAMWPKSLRNDAVAEKRLNFGHAGVWRVGCRSILLEISNWEFLPSNWFTATSHTSHASMAEIQSSFGDRVISKGTLATALAQSDAASLFLMGISERESLPNKPWTIDALKANFTKEIQAVTADVLARTSQNMARRVQSCLDENGGHFQHMLWCRHISHTTNVLLFKSHCNIFIGFRIIKEMLGLVRSGTPCIMCVWSTMIFLTPPRQGTTPQILKLTFPVHTSSPKQECK